MNSYYSKEELKIIGFKTIGKNVLISKKTSIYYPEKISIGNNVRIDDFCVLSGEITLGNYIHVAAYCALFGKMGIELKDFSVISSRVTMYSASDDFTGEFLISPTVPSLYTNVKGGKVTLEKHVLVGASSVILPNITLTEGTSVGAMSLVTKSTKSWGIYTGIPARRLKERKNDLIHLEKEFLLKEAEKNDKE